MIINLMKFSSGNKKLLIIVPIFVFIILIGASFLGFSHSQSSALIGYIHEGAFIFIGFFIYIFGSKQIYKKRLVENTPTAKIRSAAMGISELVGLAKEKYPLKSRITAANCVFYKYLIEQETKDSKGNKHWSKVSEGNSANYFYLEDNTGKILVDPLNAETVLVKDYEFIDMKNGCRVRYSEWYIQPGDYVYILGTIRKFKDNIQDRKDRLIEKLRKLKEDKNKLNQFDADGDGQISVDEWDKAKEKIEEELLKEDLTKTQELAQDDIVIAKGTEEDTFIISDRDEDEVKKKLLTRGALSTAAGLIIIVLMLISLFSRAEFVPWKFIIPWGNFYK